jgi:hypothetical protein
MSRPVVPYPVVASGVVCTYITLLRTTWTPTLYLVSHNDGWYEPFVWVDAVPAEGIPRSHNTSLGPRLDCDWLQARSVGCIPAVRLLANT